MTLRELWHWWPNEQVMAILNAIFILFALGLLLLGLKSCFGWTSARYEYCETAGGFAERIGNGRWLCVAPDGRVIRIPADPEKALTDLRRPPTPKPKGRRK